MLHFKPIGMDDRELIQSFFSTSSYRNCDFSFPNIFCWQHLYETTYAVGERNNLYIRFQGKNSKPGYTFPLGEGDLRFALEQLMEDARERGDDFRLYAITREMLEEIERAMPGRFIYEEHRSWYEYIYASTDLIHLVGKKYQPKRNHINKFKRSYQWEYLPITRAIIPECLELYKRWCRENGGCNSEETLIAEGVSVQKAFDNYEALGLVGGALRIEGRLVAYSYGVPLTQDTFDVQAEKCLPDIDGGYAMMNQQFAEHNCADFTYINREEDLGLESLRQAKLSYQPTILLEKGTLKLKEQ